MYCGIFLHSVVTLRHLSHFVIHIMLHLGVLQMRNFSSEMSCYLATFLPSNSVRSGCTKLGYYFNLG